MTAHHNRDFDNILLPFRATRFGLYRSHHQAPGKTFMRKSMCIVNKLLINITEIFCVEMKFGTAIEVLLTQEFRFKF